MSTITAHGDGRLITPFRRPRTTRHGWLRPPLLAAVILVSPAMARAQGGPPLMTDDPDTPGPGYWEINIAAIIEKNLRARTFEGPRLDVNYGVGRRVQLKLEMPWVQLRNQNGRVETGAGTATAGVKWRMVGEEGTTLAWSIYPQVSVRTASSSVGKGISDESPELLVPTEITVEIAHLLEINGEIGRTVVSGGSGRWVFGISTEGHVAPRLELLAELHAEQISEIGTATFVTVGARQKLTHTMILMCAAGRTLQSSADGSRLYLYTGIQLNLPGVFVFDQDRERATQVNTRGAPSQFH